MNDVRKMLFSLQKFQILALYTSSTAERGFNESYVFAWMEGVYPFLNESAHWHQAFEECFTVRERDLVELHNYLSGRWDQKKPITYFELEDRCGIKGPRRPGVVWSQASLINACRYFYLHLQFDDAFWSSLLASDQHPFEAEKICSKFNRDDVLFE